MQADDPDKPSERNSPPLFADDVPLKQLPHDPRYVRADSMDSRHSLVQDIAREYTKETANGGDFLHVDDPLSPINPNGDKFDARLWATNLAATAFDNGQNLRKLGLCFQNLNVFGYGASTDFQKDVANVWLAFPSIIRKLLHSTTGQTRIDILHHFDGLIRPGEMCVVLGPPGSGCSTFLKTISGETNGLYFGDASSFNYQGLSARELHSAHRGDALYTAEIDVHFPLLTVGETLTFASFARCQRTLPQGFNKQKFCDHLRDVVMAMYGISHTVSTHVGDEYTPGVSGGERKRVSIAEATLAGAPFQCWDNSTRGLDSSNAIEFCKSLKLQSELFGRTSIVSMYQAPQSAYDLFDKVLVIYEGRQIYFGLASKAKEYFVNLGFECPTRQTTPDFLTSITFPAERVPRPGCHPPRTPDEFATAWKQSTDYKTLKAEIEGYNAEHPVNGQDAEDFRKLKQMHQAKAQRLNSPYTLSYSQQVQLCIWRGFRRLKADPRLMVGMLIANVVMALIMSSLYFNMGMDTNTFFGRAVVLFIAILFNAFASLLEILTLYAQRPIVEKHDRYAFYHPSAESCASVIVDLPNKLLTAIFFNLTFYFMTNLNRAPGPFFFYLLVNFLVVLAMSGLFRSIGSLSRTEQQAMVPAAILQLGLLIFTGFVVPVDYMLGWCRWISYVNPVAYGYEALMINEFHNRNYTCSSYIPNYPNVGAENVVCGVIGSVPGQSYVLGDDFINSAYSYYVGHKWRNVGIIVAMAIFNHSVYFIASEYIKAKRSKGEVLVFRRGFISQSHARLGTDIESSSRKPVPLGKADGHVASIKGAFQGSTGTFHWNNVCYDIKIKRGTKRILDHVDGWVKPGTLTALMGVSGAGKTTLLDCLADRRKGVGIITGDMLIDGKIRDESFQRLTGYAQQQDLHLETSTVREALEFSALLRQPADISKEQKLAYVDEVIQMLEIQDYADAVVGIPGEGLNIEQRKRLTIGVELVAKPPLLLFVDEPTSGLDSQTSWAVLDLLDKLSKAGQSILCTIHQPSAMLFERFDRLLLLAEGGRTVYFGDIGENHTTLTDYFERNGAPVCPPGANPAEWVLEAIGSGPQNSTSIDWQQVWRCSPEYQTVQQELSRLRSLASQSKPLEKKSEPETHREFAASYLEQFIYVTQRVFQQNWRTPSYIYGKVLLCTFSSLFIGLVFLNAPLTMQGVQNQLFALFELCSIFGQLVDQQLPQFVTQRKLYEIRERPSNTYSWKIFMLSQIVSEIPWTAISSVFMWALIYYPVGFNHNAGADGTERAVLTWLLFWQFLLFTSTFAHMCITFSETADEGGNVANLLFILVFFFCGVLATPEQMPGFWIFLYRVSPLSYWISAVLSTGIANVEVTCAANEYTSILLPDDLQTCGEYMAEYISTAGGYVLDPAATADCRYCKIRDTNSYLSAIHIEYDDRWRNFGIVWAYIVFNVAAAFALYWLARMPKGSKRNKVKA